MDRVIEIRNRNKAMAGTIIMHALLITFLLLYTLAVPVPLPGDIDMELELTGGILDAGGGGGGSSSNTPTEAASLDDSSTPEELISDDIEEEAPAVPPVINPVKNTKPVVNNTKPNNTTKPVNTKPTNPNATFNANMANDDNGTNGSNGNGNNGSNGDGNNGNGGNGNNGTNGDGNKPGVYGNGDFNLTGRQLKYRPTISEKVQEAGRVVINIYVNRDGKVTRTSVNEQLTNTANKRLRDLAIEAAKKTTWSAKGDAAFEQKGTFTFKFTLN